VAEFRRAAAEQLAAGEARKAAGAEAWRGGGAEAAERAWAEALDLALGALGQEALGRIEFADLKKRAEGLALACHLNLAAAALGDGCCEEALGHCRRALDLDPRSVKALYRCGQAHRRLQRPAEAAEVLGRALALDPANQEVRRARTAARTRVANFARPPGRGAAAAGAEGRQGDPGLAAAGVRGHVRAFGGRGGRGRLPGAGGRPRPAAAALPGAGAAGGRPPRPGGAAGASARVCWEAAAAAAVADLRVPAPQRWESSGSGALDGAERALVERLARAAAAAGGLDSAADRDLAVRHGLGGAFKAPGGGETGDGLSADERARWREQQEILKVKALADKVRGNQSITDEERAFLCDWRQREIDRLEAQLAGAGISQEETAVLAKLKEKQAQERHLTAEAQALEREVQAKLDLLDSGRRVPLRDRLRIAQILEEQERALEKADDETGLDTTQLRVLRELKAARRERERKLEAARRKREQQAAALQSAPLPGGR